MLWIVIALSVIGFVAFIGWIERDVAGPPVFTKPQFTHLRAMLPEEYAMRRTIKIEIKANLTDEEYDALKAALKDSVRTICAMTAFIGQRPQVVMTGSDFFTASEEIDLADDDAEERV